MNQGLLGCCRTRVLLGAFTLARAAIALFDIGDAYDFAEKTENRK